MKRILILCLLVVGFVAAGCGNNPDADGLSSTEKEAASRLDQIAKSSGGDWSKVSQSDKDYMLQQFHSEQTAKKMLQNKAGLLKGKAGGKGAQ